MGLLGQKEWPDYLSVLRFPVVQCCAFGGWLTATKGSCSTAGSGARFCFGMRVLGTGWGPRIVMQPRTVVQCRHFWGADRGLHGVWLYCRIGSMVWNWHACVGDRLGSVQRHAAKYCGSMLRPSGLVEGCHGVLLYCRTGGRVHYRPECVGHRLGSAQCHPAMDCGSMPPLLGR